MKMKLKVSTGIISLFVVMVILVGIFPNMALASTNFNGSQSSTYNLSNGRRVRIEYHGGEPHYHELDSNGRELGSENLANDKAHHSDGRKPSKGTRDRVKGNKQKSQGDKNAKKKGDQLKKEWEKAQSNAKKASKNFVKKNKSTIQRTAKNGGIVVVIGGCVYLVWWLLKIASGWGILIPV